MPVTINASTSSGLVQTADTSGQIELQTNGTTVATVNTSNNVQFRSSISVGNATPTTSGAGITFPATQSASSDANTLDDYEEGTWTITDQSGAGLTLSNTTGRYIKVGRAVYITCFFGYPSTATANTAKVSLPFAVSLEYASFSKSYISGAGNTNWLPLTDLGTSLFGFRDPSNGDTQASNANLSSRSVIVTGWYITSA